ncbi:MAG: hypothetical protein AB1551_03130 [Actinomycetota bacterium]
MKKAASVVLAALAYCLLVAVPAFAGSEVPPPSGPQVEGEVVRAGGTAFTGANISLGVLLVVVLLLAGVALLAISRRRATAGR